ncbi:MAG TPA: hypothetical protein VF945_19410 [Polyangia bacterium]
MFTVSNTVGELLEIRVSSPFSLDDAGALFKKIYKTVPPGRSSRVFCDLRQLRVVDPEIIDFVSGMMRQDNPFVERNALLMPPVGALITLQGDRLLKQLGTDNRRTFSNRGEAEAWMAERLPADEQARLAAFLDEGE